MIKVKWAKSSIFLKWHTAKLFHLPTDCAQIAPEATLTSIPAWLKRKKIRGQDQRSRSNGINGEKLTLSKNWIFQTAFRTFFFI